MNHKDHEQFWTNIKQEQFKTVPRLLQLPSVQFSMLPCAATCHHIICKCTNLALLHVTALGVCVYVQSLQWGVT